MLVVISDSIVGRSSSWGRGGIGIRNGLKIRRRKACGFESHRPYHNSLRADKWRTISAIDAVLRLSISK